MNPIETTAHDQVKYLFNVFTGEFDMVLKFNPDRLVTNCLNQAGNPLVVYDPMSGLYLEAGPSVVVDNNGSVVNI